ncbi:MAG TPA: DUF417 family protein [Anaerolineae bacterium]|nr:DUF417 family protein [Anaerolineae bacterium]
MATWRERYEKIEIKIVNWMGRYGINLLRISMGIVFFWFGFLKFFPGISPAEGLATKTIETLSFGILTPKVSIIILAVWETLIGLGFLSGKFLRATLVLLFLQMLGTITPLFLFPHEAFTAIPYAPTLEGQYIIKNLVLISAGMVIGGTLRGATLAKD